MPTLLLYGSVEEDLAPDVQRFVGELVAQAFEYRWTLVSMIGGKGRSWRQWSRGAWCPIDNYVIRAVDKTCRSAGRPARLVLTSYDTHQARNHATRVTPYDIGQKVSPLSRHRTAKDLFLIKRTSAVLLIGGRAGVIGLGYACHFLKHPFLCVGQFGGAAKELCESFYGDDGRRYYRHLSIDAFERLKVRATGLEAFQYIRAIGGNVKRTSRKPSVFIGSSSEGLKFAEELQDQLRYSAEVKIWTQDFIRPSRSVMDSVLAELKRFDFAVLVLTPDDITIKRRQEQSSPRDNVVFELGLFIGALGLRRTFFVLSEGRRLHLPSDLLGIVPLTFDRVLARKNLSSAIGPVVTKLKREMARRKPRSKEVSAR